MSKFIVLTTSDGERFAVRKDRITDVTENGTNEDPTRVWTENEEEPYQCCDTFEEVLAKLED